MTTARPSADEIEAWLVLAVARRLKTSPDAINPEQDFAGYGLDSVGAVAISADLERWLGVELDETLLWDYPSIRRLARHLAEQER